MVYDSEYRILSEQNIIVYAEGTKPLSWDVKNLPKGVGFKINNDDMNPIKQTLTLSGRPEESGDFAVIVTASNDWGVSSLSLIHI